MAFDNRKMAFVLMAAGALPFLAAAALTLSNAGDVRGYQADQIAVAYGAVILSFLGGIRWGAAINQGRAATLLISVLPSLAGFLALLVPQFIAGLILIAGFSGQVLWDVMSSGTLPKWFIRLRVAISAVVIACLAITLAF